MFDNLSEKLQNIISKTLRQELTQDNMQDALREIRRALLEAYVNLRVVKSFISSIKDKAEGENILQGVNPSQQLIKIVNDELVELLGKELKPLDLSGHPSLIMMLGLQGSGKTTSSAKLAVKLKKDGKNPLLVACDVYRPAAIDQLKQIGRELNIPVYDEGKGNPIDIAKNGVAFAKENGFDYVLLDTAGRLHIDEALMDELNNINNEVKPNEILLVVDSMTGQDAINVIEGFNSSLPLTGAILTKMDGDTRGGAALSIRHLTNIPIKFVGVSEKMDGIEPFYPDRIATRILGMGDIMTMLEKAEEAIDQDEAMKAAKKMQSGKFDLEDFLSQMKQIKKLGPLENLIKLIPGVPKELKSVKIDPKDMAHIEAIILSMTPYERRHPEVLKATRKQRIAKGSARSVEEVNRLLKQFDQMKVMMKQFKSGNFKMPF